MDDDDIFMDGPEAERMIAKNDMRLIQDQLTQVRMNEVPWQVLQMGFRQGLVESMENKDRASVLQGIDDGFNQGSHEAYLKGKLE